MAMRVQGLLLKPGLLQLALILCFGLAQAATAAPARLHIVVADKALATVRDAAPQGAQLHELSRLDQAQLLKALSDGDSLVWIGDGSRIPPELWVGQFRPAEGQLQLSLSAGSPLNMRDLNFRPAALFSGYIKPPREMPLHNVDEEPRADLFPLLEARDRFDRTIGYPGFLMHYYAPSLVGRRFRGSECFFFLFEDPTESLP